MVVASRVASCSLWQGALCLATSAYATTIQKHVDMLIRAALELDGRACIVILSICKVCGGVGENVRSRQRRRAKPALPAASASPCQYAPPQIIDMFKYIPKQLYSLFEELVVLYSRCVQCMVVWNREYRCGGVVLARKPACQRHLPHLISTHHHKRLTFWKTHQSSSTTWRTSL